MSVTKEQVRAARAYLEWDRDRLSQESGVSVPQIANFETGKTESPRISTLQALEDAFKRQHIVFEKGGLFRKKDFTRVVEGEGWYLKVLDDVYHTLIDQKSPELLCLCTDDKASPAPVNDMLRKMRTAGIHMRQLVEEENTYLMGSVKEYKYIPKDLYRNYPALIYGDKVAICTEGNTKAIIFDDFHLARTWRNIFEVLWMSLKPAEKSDAKERF